ncbi:MAG: trehalose utilization [Planctomycetaceae bacterium]|nr:trehalose utilization [Planctomycetaceae bacterium]
MKSQRCLIAACLLLVMAVPAFADPMKALIVEGQNNHRVWPKTTKMMKQYLEQIKLFRVDVARTAAKGTDPDFQPDFAKYNVVISNYNGAAWPKKTQEDFVSYVKGGGGFVVVHAANNAFGNWPEYNEIIGLGGWGGRNEKSGPYVYFNDEGKLVRDETKGRGGSHGSQHDFSVVVRDRSHPITKGLPTEWMHVKDELYDRLRGPAANMHVLATAYASQDHRGTGRHEPMMMTISYGKGRIFHTPMGHGDYSQECVGFITVLQRGSEWAATGKVTVPVPDDFPTARTISKRAYKE